MSEYTEKRRLFLQSYHFSRKKGVSEKLRCSVARVRRLIWVKLRVAAKRVPRSVWQRLQHAWSRYRWRRFRLHRFYRPIVCNRNGSC